MRVAFMGSPAFAVPSLHAVARTCDLRVVVCQPDRPAGRGRSMQPPPVKVTALELGVEVIQPERMRDGTLAARLRDHALDVAVVVAFGRILQPDVLSVPRYGCLNVHASLLPRWRGAAPIQRAILAGDNETGVCIMQMDAGLDTGDVHVTQRTMIEASETSGALFERLSTVGADVLAAFLLQFPDVPSASPQSDEGVCYASRLRKEEGAVDWHCGTIQLSNHIRGMEPWPGAVTSRRGEPLKLFGASRLEEGGLAPFQDSASPGTVLGMHRDSLWIAGTDGFVGVREVQPAGRRRMPSAAYVAGHPFAQGERLGPATT